MNRIKQLRVSKGWKQDDLAELLDVQRAVISKYETGSVSLTDETVKRIADIFEVSTDYLLGVSEIPTQLSSMKELEALLADSELRTEFQDYSAWTEEEKRTLLNFIKAQNALRRENSGK